MRFSFTTVAAALALISTPVLADLNSALTQTTTDVNKAINDLASVPVNPITVLLDVVAIGGDLTGVITAIPSALSGGTSATTVLNTIETALCSILQNLINKIKALPGLSGILSILEGLLSTFLTLLSSALPGTSITCLSGITTRDLPLLAARAGGATIPVAAF